SSSKQPATAGRSSLQPRHAIQGRLWSALRMARLSGSSAPPLPLWGRPPAFPTFAPRGTGAPWGGFFGAPSFGGVFFKRLDASGNPVLDANGMPIFDLLPDPTLRANGNDADQWYTRIFNGTSSATPIVTGAAALIQSIGTAAGHAPLSSVDMRTLLA